MLVSLVRFDWQIDPGVGFWESCYYMNPFFGNIFRCGDSIILRYSCDWKIVTRGGKCLYKEGGPEGLSLLASTVPCAFSPPPATRMSQRCQGPWWERLIPPLQWILTVKAGPSTACLKVTRWACFPCFRCEVHSDTISLFLEGVLGTQLYSHQDPEISAETVFLTQIYKSSSLRNSSMEGRSLLRPGLWCLCRAFRNIPRRGWGAVNPSSCISPIFRHHPSLSGFSQSVLQSPLYTFPGGRPWTLTQWPSMGLSSNHVINMSQVSTNWVVACK